MRLTNCSALRLTSMRWLMLVISLNACFTWRPAQLTPGSQFRRTDQVRVERANQRRTVMLHLQMRGDTLVGHKDDSDRPVAILLGDVQRAETLHFNGRKTAMSVAVILAGSATAVGRQWPTWTPGDYY